jgi:hypothetical protein
MKKKKLIFKNYFLKKENLANYVSSCARLGLPSNALFAPADLFDDVNLPLVVHHVFCLARSHVNTSPHSIRGTAPLSASASEPPPPPPPDDDISTSGASLTASDVRVTVNDDADVSVTTPQIVVPTSTLVPPLITVVSSPPTSPRKADDLMVPQASSSTAASVISPRSSYGTPETKPKKFPIARVFSAANPQLAGGANASQRHKAATFIGGSTFAAPDSPQVPPAGAGGGAAASPPSLSAPVPTGSEERTELLRDLLPRLLAANRSLKDQVQELEERNADLARENAELSAQLSRLSAAPTSSGGDEGLILGNYNGQVALKAATPEKLMDALHNPASPGAVAFVTTYLYTYRAWTDSITVIDRIKQTFVTIITAPAATDLVVVDSRRQQVLLICNVLKKWIEMCWYDFEQSQELTERLNALIPMIEDHDKGLGATLDRALRRAMKRSAEVQRQKQRIQSVQLAQSPVVSTPDVLSTATGAAAAGAAAPAATATVAASGGAATAAAAASSSPLMSGGAPSLPTGAAATSATSLVASPQSLRRAPVTNHMTLGGVPTVTNASVVHDKPPPPPILSKKAPREVEEIDTVELARQVTLMMFSTFQRVEPWELLDGAFSKKDKATRAPNVVALTEQFNDFSSWVVYNVVTQMDLKKRAALVRKFIAMAEELRRIGNLNGVFAIVAGLSGAPVHRLKKTWELVSKEKKSNDAWEFQLELTNPQSSFSQYRSAKSSIDPPAIPYLGVYLQDLTFIEEGNNDKLENGYVNFVKFRMIADILVEIKQFQQKEYNLQPVPSIQEYLLATRILDEEKLFALSQQVEPRAKK